jgi:hypothetical protein
MAAASNGVMAMAMAPLRSRLQRGAPGAGKSVVETFGVDVR